MRRLLLLGALGIATACGAGSKAKGPAWPVPSSTAEDGGESLAPRETSVATVVEKSADKDAANEEKAKPAAETTAATEPTETKPEEPAATPSQPIDDDEIISDEIIIEVEE